MSRSLARAVSVLLPLATLAVYLWLVLGPGAALIEAADGLPPPDLRIGGYDLLAMRAWLAALSPEGVALYLGPVAFLDTLLPALIGLTLLWWTRPVPGLRDGLFVAVCAATALAYVALDLAENATVGAMVRAGPVLIEPAKVAMASNFTQAKFAALALALVLAARQGWRRRRLRSVHAASGTGGTAQD